MKRWQKHLCVIAFLVFISQATLSIIEIPLRFMQQMTFFTNVAMLLYAVYTFKEFEEKYSGLDTTLKDYGVKNLEELIIQIMSKFKLIKRQKFKGQKVM